jgi:DNA (cytosine-5)-methyltransferase 1
MTGDKLRFIEFFAGGGMARAGLGDGWQCVFANDFDEKKAASYRDNWGHEHLVVDDVANVRPEQIDGQVDLAWASFPCQDLSLAGDYVGLTGERSGTFWPFWKLMRALGNVGRAPRAIILENVYGALTSHGGNDFRSIARAFSGAGYRFGAMVMDARHFLPQSRPRLFFVGVRAGEALPHMFRESEPSAVWHPKALRAAHESLSATARSRWIWWSPSVPSKRNLNFADIIEERPTGVQWHDAAQTKYVLSLMADRNLRKVREAQRLTRASGGSMVGGVYRRTRDGKQRAEVRFDDVAGCLRTPVGGSSRQTVLVVNRGKVRTRLLSPREAARLMGLDDDYILPTNYNQAYHLAGDGVAVPVVRHIASELLEPILLPAIEAQATG